MGDACICYLCGEEVGARISRDHVPPKQFYPSAVRKADNPNLLTLPVHPYCNQSYQKDELYVAHAVGVIAAGAGTNSGRELWADMASHYSQPDGKGLGLGKRILSEFDLRPSGLFLPRGKIVKRFDGERVRRVVWKITRGLFFKERDTFLPERTPRVFHMLLDREPPPEFAYVRDTPSKGEHPEVFDYKYVEFPRPNAHYWAFLLWNALILTAFFHDPACPCEECTGEAGRT